MQDDKNNPTSDEFLDEVAVNVIGAQTADERAAFNQRLTAVGPEQQNAAADLQDAAARMAAASPYMEPPERLRAAILAVTAPANFKIEDYRRASGEHSRRYLWWAVAAAAICLVWSGYDGMLARKDSAQIAGMAKEQAQHIKQQDQQIAQLSGKLDDEHKAIKVLLDPNVRQADILVRTTTGQTITGRLLVDSRTNGMMVVLPDTVTPANSTVNIVLEQNGQKTALSAIAVGFGPGSASVRSPWPQSFNPDQPFVVNVNDGPATAGMH